MKLTEKSIKFLVGHNGFHWAVSLECLNIGTGDSFTEITFDCGRDVYVRRDGDASFTITFYGDLERKILADALTQIAKEIQP